MFRPLTAKPAKDNKYYISSKYGKKEGYNPCILGNTQSGRDKYLNVLPNCTGWATGRFNEIIGKDECLYLGNTDARNYIALAKSQGLEVGTEPQLGACAVWDDGLHGHVAIVEAAEKTRIRVSQSGWTYKGKDKMWLADHTLGDGNWTAGDDQSWMKGKYKFLGFIYQPEEIMTQDEFNEMMEAYLDGLKKKPPDSYAKDALKWAEENGLIQGSGLGQMPQAFVKREDLALVLKRYNDL